MLLLFLASLGLTQHILTQPVAYINTHWVSSVPIDRHNLISNGPLIRFSLLPGLPAPSSWSDLKMNNLYSNACHHWECATKVHVTSMGASLGATSASKNVLREKRQLIGRWYLRWTQILSVGKQRNVSFSPLSPSFSIKELHKITSFP